jgi:hypothetical protein
MPFAKISFCPCGSGKPIFQCCLKGKAFDSAEEVQAEAGRIISKRNRQKLDDFRGLSAEQMRGPIRKTHLLEDLISFDI